MLEKYFLLGDGGGHGFVKENLKLHNLGVKSIFRITSLISFRSVH